MALRFDCTKLLRCMFSKAECENIAWWFRNNPRLASIANSNTNQLLNIIKTHKVLESIAHKRQLTYNKAIDILNQDQCQENEIITEDAKHAIIWDMFGDNNDWIRYSDNKSLLSRDFMLNIIVLTDTVDEYLDSKRETYSELYSK